MRATVVTLNVLASGERWPERRRLIRDELERLDPDVVCLQEVGPDDPVVGEAFAHHLVRNPVKAGGIKNLVLASRVGFDDVRVIELPADDLAVMASVGGATVVTTHLHFEPTREGSAVRAAQAEAILAALPAAGPVVIAGDCNGVPKPLAERLEQATRPEWTSPTPLIEAPEEWRNAIDHVFIGGGVRCTRWSTAFDEPVEGLWPSDHLGLCASLEW